MPRRTRNQGKANPETATSPSSSILASDLDISADSYLDKNWSPPPKRRYPSSSSSGSGEEGDGSPGSPVKVITLSLNLKFRLFRVLSSALWQQTSLQPPPRRDPACRERGWGASLGQGAQGPLVLLVGVELGDIVASGVNFTISTLGSTIPWLREPPFRVPGLHLTASSR